MTKTLGDYDFLFKLVLVGDAGVGKSCVLLRFSEDAFNSTYKATIGIDFGMKIIEFDGKKIKLQFWDTGGQEKFRSAVPFSYYGRGAKGIMLVYDITNDETFENIKNWIREIDEHVPSDVVTMLIGNKCDMENERRVSREMASQLATERGIKFMEVSAQATININEAFYTISRDMLEVEERRLLHPSGMVMAKTLPDYDFLLKLVLIGDPVVGKTCVLLRFSEDAFNLRYKATIGIDFRIKIIKLDGKKIKLQIWDTSGQEGFYDAATTYCRDAMGIMLVYDITNDTYFENTKKWFRTIKEHAPSDVVTMLIGNKCDIKDDRMVSREMASQFATEHGMKFLEVSAKEDINIDEAFYTLARDILAVQERRLLEERKRQQSKGFLSSVRGFFGKLGLKSQQTSCQPSSSSQQTLQPKEPVHEKKPPEETTAAEDGLLSQSRDAQAKEDFQLVGLGQASQENP